LSANPSIAQLLKSLNSSGGENLTDAAIVKLPLNRASGFRKSERAVIIGMRVSRSRRRWLILAAAFGIFFIVAVGAAMFLNPWMTHYIESDAFREAMERGTAKGLHFPSGHYGPIRRTGFWTAQSERFQASSGEKAMKSIETRGIAAKLDPWAVFVRSWQLDEVHIQSAEVEIQIYEHKPEPVSLKSWFSVFLPNRVDLKRVESESANVTWPFRGERAGFFGTRLLITPHGRDFDYRATGGILKMALIPDLYLRQAHVFITKTLLTLYDVDFAPGASSEGGIHAEGKAGIGDDKSLGLNVNFDRLPIRDWLPKRWKGHFSGNASGNIRWAGENPKLENSSGKGSLRVGEGRIDKLPILEKVAELAQETSYLELSDCSLSFAWRYPKIEITEIAFEEKGKFRIEGTISLDRRSLRGTIKIGLARQSLDWLPNPEEVFTHKRSGYLWTVVHLSGTIDEPKQDLSPRIIELFKESPSAYLGLLFRQFETWLKKTFSSDR
jgi:hypothetical protein